MDELDVAICDFQFSIFFWIIETCSRLEAIDISFDLLIQSPRGRTIQCSQITVEHHLLATTEYTYGLQSARLE